MEKKHRKPAEIDEILTVLRQIHVESERDEIFRARLDRFLHVGEDGRSLPRAVKFKGNGDTRGIVLIDGPGGGKTTVVGHVLRNHPALQAPSAEMSPRYLGVRVPSPATLKSLGCEILRQSGYPEVSERRERWNIWDLVRKRLDLLGVVVLWIDEAHDLFATGSDREARDILKTLKSLMQGEGAVIVILTGIEDLWQIAQADTQVKRRFVKLMLPGVTEATDGDDLWELLVQFCQRADLAPPERGDLVGRLVHASRSRFGRSIETMINAIEEALYNGDAALDRQHFVEAYAVQEGCPPEDNIFLAKNWADIDPDPVETT